ncbi:MAG: hypothetical protein ABJC62_07555 [Frankiaceae bacterium]
MITVQVGQYDRVQSGQLFDAERRILPAATEVNTSQVDELASAQEILIRQDREAGMPEEGGDVPDERQSVDGWWWRGNGHGVRCTPR